MRVILNVFEVDTNKGVTFSSPWSIHFMRDTERLGHVSLTMTRGRWRKLGEPSTIRISLEEYPLEEYIRVEQSDPEANLPKPPQVD